MCVTEKNKKVTTATKPLNSFQAFFLFVECMVRLIIDFDFFLHNADSVQNPCIVTVYSHYYLPYGIVWPMHLLYYFCQCYLSMHLLCVKSYFSTSILLQCARSILHLFCFYSVKLQRFIMYQCNFPSPPPSTHPLHL